MNRSGFAIRSSVDCSSTIRPSSITRIREHASRTTGNDEDTNRTAVSKPIVSSFIKPDNLRSHGDVERLRDVVRDQQSRVCHQRVHDQRTLHHAAREMRRIVVKATSRRGDADGVEQFDDLDPAPPA